MDPYFNKKKWKMEIINNCRTYLRIFCLSEMALNNCMVDRGFDKVWVKRLGEVK